MKKDNLKITDEGGEWKYFSAIPHYIVNHSTAYEQSLYLVMKRFAGEKGSCFASLNKLSQMMGVHKNTVSKTINKLIEREWIREVESVKVQGGVTRQFVIVDLWQKAVEFYQSQRSGAKVTTSQSGAINDGSGANIDRSGAQSDTKNTYKNKDKNIDERFEIFWKEYPRKVNKKGALRSWNRIKPNENQIKAIMVALENHKESDQWNRDNGAYIPHTTTWLNQERWKSHLPKAKAPIKKPFYHGDPMINQNGKWFVIKNGEWLKFVGREEEIIYE